MTNDKIVLGHGSGGRLARKLIEDIISPALGSGDEFGLNDSAVLDTRKGRLAFTTDSYIIDPVFFPGGDIGKLAVCGTVNDLLMAGARPMYLSLGLILEEGFLIEDLKKILASIRATADDAGIKIATGDTKILPSGKGDGIFINTAGVGEIIGDITFTPENVKEGDKVIVTGTLGDHSAAVMIAREKLAVKSGILSDCAHLSRPILALMENGYNIKCMRDPTRGGVAGVLNEIATVASAEVYIDETSLSVEKEVRAVCEVLGLDPLYMANEGKAVIFAGANDARKIVKTLARFEETSDADIVGEVRAGRERARGRVILKTVTGGERILIMPAAEQLPRIC